MTMEMAQSTIQEIRRIFAERDDVLEELDMFEKTKDKYDKNPVPETSLPMKMAYMHLTSSLKVGVSAGQYSQADYFRFTEALKTFPNEADV